MYPKNSSVDIILFQLCLQIRVWRQPDLINLASFALNVSDLVQTYFDDYLDFQYPLAKQGIAQAICVNLESRKFITKITLINIKIHGTTD